MITQELDSSFEDPPGDDPARPAMIELPSADAGRLQRMARALLGWMAPAQADLVLASNRMGIEPTPEQRACAQQARDAVAARPIGIDQKDAVTALPSALAGHVARLRATPAGEQMLREGWNVAIVDLDRVVGFQPVVFTDSAVDRVRDVDPNDLDAIAALTLPVDHPGSVAGQFDQLKQAYVFTSLNPNLRVMGNFGGSVPESNGLPVFGFMVGEVPSFVQVACCDGRLILRDGYHRTFGLLSRGIKHVPAFIRDFDSVENVAPAGMLPYATWLGARPPLLRDYHDDTVAATVRLPLTQKMVVIQALELSLAS